MYWSSTSPLRSNGSRTPLGRVYIGPKKVEKERTPVTQAKTPGTQARTPVIQGTQAKTPVPQASGGRSSVTHARTPITQEKTPVTRASGGIPKAVRPRNEGKPPTELDTGSGACGGKKRTAHVQVETVVEEADLDSPTIRVETVMEDLDAESGPPSATTSSKPLLGGNRNLIATKADNSAIPVWLWNDAIREGLSSDPATRGHMEGQINAALDSIRTLFLHKQTKLEATRSYFRYLRTEHPDLPREDGPVVECHRDTKGWRYC
jgi:hypothetical protein